MKTLIADCGSTSARWALFDSAGKSAPAATVTTPGFNASALGVDEIKRVITPAADIIGSANVIRFYGAGCRKGEPSERVAEALAAFAPEAGITVMPDIYASIHALAPDDTALVAIVGTGVNAVVASHGEIIDYVTSTGYILGDHGSGAALGRSLMDMYVSGRLPETLKKALEAEYGITPSSVIDSVYRGTSPRSFLGSFAPFLLRNAGDPAIAGLLDNSFSTFVSVSLLPLLTRHHVDIRLSGSIAFHFRPYIEKSLAALMPEARITAVTANPIDCIRS
ncbi:MAG: hypothetical protein K2L14_08740 [Duncaniella sp.]|nr:hypothetical protein [Duncaniella sp.]